MEEFIISYDLGTSSVKSSLFNHNLECVCNTVADYKTFYPEEDRHEQRPLDWWNAIVKSTKELLAKSLVIPKRINAIALSGQSLTAIPLDNNGQLLMDRVPIWSDTSAKDQSFQFFQKTDEEKWYLRTGNGFSRECYSIFKIMKIRDEQPELYKKISVFLGSKDYINYLLTGQIATDYSYASGLGAYDLVKNQYDEEYLDLSGVSQKILPNITASTERVGTITKKAARELGLTEHVSVFCGGVDNSCMALGAGIIDEGNHYMSLGSSAWIAVSTSTPIIDDKVRPFIFSHVVPKMYTSATAIFSAGSTFRWIRDVVCTDMKNVAQQKDEDVYDQMINLAMESSVGANGLLFNPSMGGTPSSYHSKNILGGFYGLTLAHEKKELIRAVLEGICIDLFVAYQKLKGISKLSNEVIFVGGGSKNSKWRQMFADVFKIPFVKINIDQDAASLGAASIAAVGMGWWKDFKPIQNIVKRIGVSFPEEKRSQDYSLLESVYQKTWRAQSEIGFYIHEFQKEIRKD